ncbi:MAG: shikimate dehydrogenase [Candidatus Kentron sp. G]|nr:MAG: shikimate dehydrogenase [Candidatus Kentron sp. G]VFN07242.1 MAG: shikimate dehydrogenase [Candidatus Kentron sp. G]VFN07913.1 MAG: shikimate dehydrogenase [Candidatus Kentron sp. G]
MMERYGVIGHPIEHSKSPLIHSWFAKQTRQSMAYLAIHVLPGEFVHAISAFHAEGGRGINVTLPFKEEAKDLVDVLTVRARRANAVNTIRFNDSGEKYGDNTDGIGLIRDLHLNHGMPVAGRRVLLLGAGGAARGIIGPLLDESPEEFVVANRTREKAEVLVTQVLSEEKKPEIPVRGCGLEELVRESFDLIINATSASLEGKVPPLPDTVLRVNGQCYDTMYDVNRPTPFVLWGKQHGASQSVDGLGMLVEQAAEAFYYWRGIRPDTMPVITALRSKSAPEDS